MLNFIKGSLVCLCLSLVFSGSALAANLHRSAKQKSASHKVALYVFDSTSESFADFLSPGVSLSPGANIGLDVSSFFQNKNAKSSSNATWAVSSFLLILPYVNQELGGLLALSGNLTPTGWDTTSSFNPIGFNPVNYFQPAVLLVFYQQQISAVPEASAGVMMALGLPLLGWLVWRRQRSA